MRDFDHLDDYGFEKYETNEFPLAFLLTFRTYGTWHHGDKRYSVGRNGMNLYGSPKFQPSVPFVDSMQNGQTQPAIILDKRQRALVASAITEVCSHREYAIRALSVRTNHVHVVVSASVRPEKIVNAFKAYATRKLRTESDVNGESKVWSRGASTRYLWKPKHVVAAVDYVLYCQEDIPFEFTEAE
jgi:REP element-mobilizing transposase RayT